MPTHKKVIVKKPKANKRITPTAKSNLAHEIISIYQFSKIAMTFWLGGSWMTAAVLFPIISDVLDPVTAGNIFQQVLHINAYIGIVCLSIALIEVIVNHRLSLFKSRRFWYILVMGLILMVNDFAIFPPIYKIRKDVANIAHKLINVQSSAFDFWHSFSAALFIITCILGVLYLIDM